MSRTIYSIESHEQALDIWRDQRIRSSKLLHIDFHCDQRGLLVNRKTQRAFKIWTRFPQVDEGNFLTHAILGGIISQVRWVHDQPGGRRDDIKSVKFETDMSALIHRGALALQGDKGIPFKYQVLKTSDWFDIEPGEILDIDWDYFAANEYSADSIQPRIDAFLSRDFGQLPEQTIVCYSPEYSHPTRAQFRDFVQELAFRFDADVVEIARPATVKKIPFENSLLQPILRPARQLYHHSFHTLRKCGIY